MPILAGFSIENIVAAVIDQGFYPTAISEGEEQHLSGRKAKTKSSANKIKTEDFAFAFN